MHVLHIDEQMTWRGGEQQAIWLIEGLIAQGVCISAIGKKGSGFVNNLEQFDGVTVYTLPLLSEWDLYSAYRIANIARTKQVDIIHAHTSHAHSLGLLARMLYPKLKVVVSRRVSFPPKNNRWSQWKYQNADVILPVSYFVAEILKHSGIPNEKIRVVRSSINLKHVEQKPYTKQELGIDESNFFIFSAGALVPHKDHITLIRALARVIREIPNLALWIAGEGPLKTEIENEIHQLKLGDYVRLLGHRNDVPRLIRTADVYVSSSWSEGLGTSVLEALACEKIVIATEAGGVPEMVIPNETGILIPARDPEQLANSILEVYHHRDNYQSLAQQGRKHVERYFTVERMVSETLQVYRDILHKNYE